MWNIITDVVKIELEKVLLRNFKAKMYKAPTERSVVK